MSLISLAMNLLLACLLGAALVMGWRLNRRLAVLRESHEGFAKAVAELDTAAQRAEQGLADLRAATDEAVDLLADRIEKARELAQKLERLGQQAQSAPARHVEAAPTRRVEPVADREFELELRQPVDNGRPVDLGRLGGLIGGAHTPRPRPAPAPVPPPRREAAAPPPRPRAFDDDLFDDEPPARRPISSMLGGLR
jgi:hypothetical protein